MMIWSERKKEWERAQEELQGCECHLCRSHGSAEAQAYARELTLLEQFEPLNDALGG